ncbi:MAG: hypothetical protein AAFQ59_07885 [Pseudomonadota bacterium]
MQDALLHVIAHEAGHAVSRAVDRSVLGPEEDVATAHIDRMTARLAP